MRLREHLIIGGVAAAFLYFHWGLWRALLFWGATVLIDADHYWDYLWRSKFVDWSGWRMFRYYDLIEEQRENPNFLALSLFHTIEVFLAVYLLGRLWNYDFFIIILWGMLFHIFWDLIDLIYHKVPFIRALSLIEYQIRKNQMIRRGFNPDAFYREFFEKSKRPAQ
jgi:hypothetical protein